LNKSGAGKTRFFGTTEIKNISVGMGIGIFSVEKSAFLGIFLRIL
jgi:hypothetical protein